MCALTLFVSCKKEEFKLLDQFQGDYHFTYTQISESDILVSSEISNDFGVTITNKNQIKTFTNGDLFATYKIVEIKFNNETYTSVNVEKKMNGYDYKFNMKLFQDGHIEFYDFPIRSKKNVFHL